MCEKYGLGSKLCILQGPVETRGPAASRVACHGCRRTLRSTPNRPSERGRRGLLAGPEPRRHAPTSVRHTARTLGSDTHNSRAAGPPRPKPAARRWSSLIQLAVGPRAAKALLACEGSRHQRLKGREGVAESSKATRQLTSAPEPLRSPSINTLSAVPGRRKRDAIGGLVGESKSRCCSDLGTAHRYGVSAASSLARAARFAGDGERGARDGRRECHCEPCSSHDGFTSQGAPL